MHIQCFRNDLHPIISFDSLNTVFLLSRTVLMKFWCFLLQPSSFAYFLFIYIGFKWAKSHGCSQSRFFYRNKCLNLFIFHHQTNRIDERNHKNSNFAKMFEKGNEHENTIFWIFYRFNNIDLSYSRQSLLVFSDFSFSSSYKGQHYSTRTLPWGMWTVKIS